MDGINIFAVVYNLEKEIKALLNLFKFQILYIIKGKVPKMMLFIICIYN